MLFAYVGPETMLPIASFIAGALGVILMAGQRIRRWFMRLFGLGSDRTDTKCEGPPSA